MTARGLPRFPVMFGSVFCRKLFQQANDIYHTLVRSTEIVPSR
jgi:hypothetical protein